MNTFDCVKYDEKSAYCQGNLKRKFEELERAIEALKPGRARSLAITKLEEAYMWVGKAIRDEQVEERAAELQEERSNS